MSAQGTQAEDEDADPSVKARRGNRTERWRVSSD